MAPPPSPSPPLPPAFDPSSSSSALDGNSSGSTSLPQHSLKRSRSRSPSLDSSTRVDNDAGVGAGEATASYSAAPPPKQRLRTGSDGDVDVNAASGSDSVASSSSAQASTSSPTAQRRQRQPPMSRAAWTSLRQDQTDSNSTLSSEPSSVNASTGTRLPPSAAPAAPASTSAPTDIFSRNVAPAPDLSDGAPATPATPPVAPPGSAAALREHLQRRLATLSRPTHLPAGPAGPAGAASSASSPLRIPQAVFPRSVLQALLADILGLGPPRGQRTSAPTQPQQQQAQQQQQSQSQATPAGQAATSTTPPAATAPSQPQPQHQTPESQPSDTSPSNGGTSILIQGAMVSRLAARTDAQELGRRQQQMPTQSQDEDANMQDAQSAPHPAVGNDQDVQPAAQSAAAQSTDGTVPAATAPSQSPSTDDAGADEGEDSQGTGTIDEQAHMLCRLTSIATAATAASLINGQSPGTLQANAAATAPVNPNPASSPTGLATSRGTRGSMRTHYRDPNATRASAAMQTVNDSLSASQGAVRSAARGVRTRLLDAVRRFADTARRFTALDNLDHDIIASFPDVGVRPSQDARYDLADAAAIDSLIGPGISIRPSGFVETPSRTSSSTSPRPSPRQPSDGVAPIPEDTGRPNINLTEMLHEAIRGHSPNSTARPDATAGESSPPPPPQPLPARLMDILQTVREDRLEAATAPEESFERWLYDMGFQLQTAVRAMADSNGIAASHNASAAPAATSASGESSGATGTASAPTGAAATPAQPAATRPDLEGGQLSFFRTFRFPADSHRHDQDPQTLATRPAAGLVPCIIVAINSHPVEVTAQAGEQLQQQQRDSSGQQSASTTTVPPAPATGASATTATTDQTAPAPAQPSPSSPRYRQARFDMFVSGGHFPPTHPLLVEPEAAAARDVMAFMRILAARNAAALGGLGGISRKPATSPLSHDELQRSGLDVKTWKEIKERCVAADAKVSTTTQVDAANALPAEVERADAAAEADAREQSQGGAPTAATSTTADTDASAGAETSTHRADADADADVTAAVKDTTNAAPTAKTVTVPALRAGEHCLICLEDWDDAVPCRILSCRHVYHQACVDEWLQKSSNSCPTCRTLAVVRPNSASGSTAASGSGQVTDTGRDAAAAT